MKKIPRTRPVVVHPPLHVQYEKIRKSVVKVLAWAKGPALKPDGTAEAKWQVAGQGTGFLWKADDMWTVVTAFHVVSRHDDKSYKFSIVATDLDEMLVYRDLDFIMGNKDLDVAILHVENPPARLVEANVDTEALRGSMYKPGVELVFVGYPFLGESVVLTKPVIQSGIISGSAQVASGRAYIVDCMVNPGSSGGPVFRESNMEVVGIVSAYLACPTAYTLRIEGRGGISETLHRPTGFGVVVPVNRIVKMTEDARIANEKAAPASSGPAGKPSSARTR